MSEDDFQEEHHEHHLPKRNLWQRWTAWNGSFLVISILLHVLLFGGATMVVVQVVQNRKEKMKFTAPPPSANASAEHKVKPSKKTAAAAPAISKRITSSAANASIALPSMDLNSTGPDVMASVMSGMGASGLGSGASGGAGMASMPLAGLTAFGFKGGGPGGLIGHLYDLKQTKDHQPTDIKDDGTWKDPDLHDHLMQKYKNDSIKVRSVMSDYFWHSLNNPAQQQVFSDGMRAEAKFLNEFINSDWDESKLKQYYCAKEPLTSYQWSISNASAKDAVKAFQVESEVKPTHLLIVYRGKVRAPRDGTFRFVSLARGGLVCVRFNKQNVFGYGFWSAYPLVDLKGFKYTDPFKKPVYFMYGAGNWFTVQGGETYPVEIVLGLGNSSFGVNLMIEEKNPPVPYAKSKWQWQSEQGLKYQTAEKLKNPDIFYRLPLFALRKGIPASPFKMPDLKNFGSDWSHNSPAEIVEMKLNGPHITDADPADEPTVFPGVK